MKRTLTIIPLILILLFNSGTAQTSRQQGLYQKAIQHEKLGEYEEAGALYRELYESDPANYNYFTRYKKILTQQRELGSIVPLLKNRIEQRPNDTYLHLELSVLYFALDDTARAREIWTDVFRTRNSGANRSYAAYVYRDMIEYGLGGSTPSVVKDLRRISGDPELLVQYYFPNSLRYQNWEYAVEEIVTILETKPANLRYVRPDLFSQSPGSPLYSLAIEQIGNLDTDDARVLLSEIHTHTGHYRAAFEVLSQYPGQAASQKAMVEFANRMFKKEQYHISQLAADWVVKHHKNPATAATMSLLVARSQEQQFYGHRDHVSFIPSPFSSAYTDIRFASYDMQYADLLKKAMERYDSLAMTIEPVAGMARFYRAEILYQVYHDFDTALREYRSLTETRIPDIRLKVISRIADCYIARGEYAKARDLLLEAPAQYRLMVHEEDKLMPQTFFAELLAGDTDSLLLRTMRVLALLPEDDPLYNDILSYSGYIFQIAEDTSHVILWLEGERALMQNRIVRAAELYRRLLDEETSAEAIYGMRYLDCIQLLKDREAEERFWNEYYPRMLKTDFGDFFMLRYAEFIEKTQNFKNAIELYEKYLLSYQESMYYETIRQYVRQKYTTGAQ